MPSALSSASLAVSARSCRAYHSHLTLGIVLQFVAACRLSGCRFLPCLAAAQWEPMAREEAVWEWRMRTASEMKRGRESGEDSTTQESLTHRPLSRCRQISLACFVSLSPRHASPCSRLASLRCGRVGKHRFHWKARRGVSRSEKHTTAQGWRLICGAFSIDVEFCVPACMSHHFQPVLVPVRRVTLVCAGRSVVATRRSCKPSSHLSSWMPVRQRSLR